MLQIIDHRHPIQTGIPPLVGSVARWQLTAVLALSGTCHQPKGVLHPWLNLLQSDSPHPVTSPYGDTKAHPDSILGNSAGLSQLRASCGIRYSFCVTVQAPFIPLSNLASHSVPGSLPKTRWAKISALLVSGTSNLSLYTTGLNCEDHAHGHHVRNGY